MLLCIWIIRNIIGGITECINLSMLNDLYDIMDQFDGVQSPKFPYWWNISCHFAVALSLLATVIFQNRWGSYAFLLITTINMIVKVCAFGLLQSVLIWIIIMAIYISLLLFCKKDGVSAWKALGICSKGNS
ncbi:hypothetical protein HDR68_04375 [bacterium]|nr:hypothetical protein [bacterium]